VLLDRSATSDGDRLRRVEAVTDARLAHLDVDELLKELLDRVCDLLDVDTAAVLLLDSSRRFLVATAARGLEEEVRQGVQIPMGKGFAGRIAAEKRAVIIEKVDHSNVLNPILREKGILSLLGVPLVVGGAVMGVLHVGALSIRRFSEEDSALLQLVADRVALAVDASVSRAERAAATALQRSLLPAKLPDLAGFELAARYIPAGDGEVGGDWYDVFVLPTGSLCIVVGDVVGRGLPAAVGMGRLRSAMRAYAVDCDDPAELLGKLDRQVRQFEPEVMATLLCAIVDPSGEQLRLSSAGHPPPVVSASLDVPAAVLELPVDLPVGVDTTQPRHTSVMALLPGTGVCFYTDGLIERRGRSLSVGLERLRQVMSAGPAEAVCASVMGALVGAEAAPDDIAVLVLRRQDVAATDPLVLELPAVPSSLQPVRAAIRRWLTGVPATREATADLVAAVGEACANVVEHAYGPKGGDLSVRLTSEPPDVVAVVSDTGRWRPPRGRDRGRGITLMQALADHAMIKPTDTGTQVVLRRSVGWEGRG
jgi:serine phosphatase RsbU (regulator of sigma subunit)/anti-sigma regulatory factor (Ser/Thr protein kinase)